MIFWLPAMFWRQASKSLIYMMQWSTSNSQSNHFAHIPGTITWPPYKISNSESQTSLLQFFLRGGTSVYRLSLSRRSVICLSRLATDKSRYFAQPHPIIVYYFIHNCHDCLHLKFDDKFNWYDGNCNNWQMLKYILRGSSSTLVEI